MLVQVIYWGLPLLALISNSVLLLVLSLSKKDKQIRVLMAFIFVMMIWAGASLLMKLQFFPSVLFWNRMMVTAITAVPFLAYVFVSYFTNQVKKLGLLFWGAVIFFITTLNALGYMVTSAQMIPTVDNGVLTYELDYALGPWAYFGFGSVFVLLAVCLNKMRKAFADNVNQRKKLQPVLLGLFVLYVGMILNIIPEVGKYPVDFAFGLVTSGLLFTSIYKNRLVELKIVVTRTLMFTFSFSLLFGLIALVTNQVLSFFSTVDTGVSDQVFLLITTIATIILFMPLFQFLYKKIDSHFYQKLNHQNTLIKDFSLSVSNNLDLENITQRLLGVAQEITKNNRIYIFLNNKSTKSYDHFVSYKKLDKINFSFKYTHPFIRWFLKGDEAIFDDYVDNHPFFKTMWDKEAEDLLIMRFQLAVPLKYNNTLLGMLVLGRHDYSVVVTNEEISMLQTLCATASIAINNASMFKKFQEEATKDSLTGLTNHRYFIDECEKMTVDSSKHPVTLIMLNLDMFAMFNDIYGHHGGDQALIKVTQAIHFVCGHQAVKCRYGGDVFAILLANTDTNQAYEIAEKIRMRIETTSMAEPNVSKRHLTLSCGLSVTPIFAKDDKQLIDQATKALHHAKLTGKNKTVIYDSKVHENLVNEESEENHMATIYALTAAIDAKDHYTFGHSQRVAKYASAIAQKAGAPPEEVQTIHQAALLHDVGKIGVPENVLTKFDKLDDHEYEAMKMHVEMSVTIIKYLPSFNHVIPAVLGHHERWDGKGYPRKIAGENIPFSARCIAVADAFDAITSNRHYKSQLSVDYALDEIERCAGTQFDPYLAQVFVHMVRNGELIIEPSRTYVH